MRSRDLAVAAGPISQSRPKGTLHYVAAATGSKWQAATPESPKTPVHHV